MRKQVFGRKFKRDKNQRKALFSGLISSMILRGRITTTEQKAKAIKGDIEKLVTKAKRGENVAKRILQSELKPFEIERMVNEIAPAFKNKNGGYTRIIKTGRRFSDNASMAILEWSEKIVRVEKPATTKKQKKASTAPKKTSKKTVKKISSKGAK